MHILRNTTSTLAALTLGGFLTLALGCGDGQLQDPSEAEGQWEGKGTLMLIQDRDDDKEFSCPSIKYEINISRDKFDISARKFICVGMTKTFPALNFRIQNDQLMLGSKQVGLINERVFEISYSSGSGKTISIYGDLGTEKKKSEELIVTERHATRSIEYRTYAEMKLKEKDSEEEPDL